MLLKTKLFLGILSISGIGSGLALYLNSESKNQVNSTTVSVTKSETRETKKNPK